MPPAKKQTGLDTQPRNSQGRRFGGRNRHNARGRPHQPKPEPVHVPESLNTWGNDPINETWGEVEQSGWGVEQNPSWDQPEDNATEAYTRPKIEAWIRQ
jgi:hypothetical protein